MSCHFRRWLVWRPVCFLLSDETYFCATLTTTIAPVLNALHPLLLSGPLPRNSRDNEDAAWLIECHFDDLKVDHPIIKCHFQEDAGNAELWSNDAA
eukprot:1156870-Pelagomonas_calceolata.AAC.5